MANLTNLTYDNSINTAMVRHTPWPQYVLRSISPADPAVQFCPKRVGAIAHHTRVINLSSPSLTPYCYFRVTYSARELCDVPWSPTISRNLLLRRS